MNRMNLTTNQFEASFQQMVYPARVFVHQFDDDGTVPNNPSLALVIYKKALLMPGKNPTEYIEQLFARNHWDAGRSADPFVHHYHSTAHEALAVVRGSATFRLGGVQGIIHNLRAGDVAIIPAGVAHQKLRASDNFHCMSAFPAGQPSDFCSVQRDERAPAARRVARVALPKADPVYGAQGPLLELWTARRSGAEIRSPRSKGRPVLRGNNNSSSGVATA
jgi:uncharacterized protein YjlB